MDHVTFIPTVDQLNYTFGGAAPVMRIKPGTVLTLWTEDAYGGRITSRDDVATRALGLSDSERSAPLALRFSGDVWAIPEGRIVTANEPLIEVTAPIAEAQVV